MTYKCQYAGQEMCDNCEHEHGSLTCKLCTEITEDKCPIARGKKYPTHRKICRKCLFKPKSEVEKMTGLKTCRKCGNIPKLVENAGLFELHCECGRTTPICGSVEKAKEEWNNNVADLGGKKLEPLKPCRCGVMPHLEAIKYRGSTHYRYECPNCGTTTLDYATGAEAKDAWNSWVGKPTDVTDCAIKDSGERREFETGAVRDMAEGKGLMVVMPAAAILRLSRHYEHGAKKYGKFNWQKGIPTSSFMDSALRHIMKYLDGWDDEDHLAAAAFNILGAMEMEAHKPAMQDIPAREGCVSFNYVEYPSN